MNLDYIKKMEKDDGVLANLKDFVNVNADDIFNFNCDDINCWRCPFSCSNRNDSVTSCLRLRADELREIAEKYIEVFDK